MHWLYLAVAIVLEVAGTTSMKLSDGFSKIIPSITMFVFYVGSFTFLTMALRKIELGTSYAIWSGLGTAAIAIIGIFFFAENASLMKMFSIALIIAGVVGLNLANSH
jgi:small multidrug resistance pump